MYLARLAPGIGPQTCSKACRAAPTARSTSAAAARATSASGSSDAGLTVVNVRPPAGGGNLPVHEQAVRRRDRDDSPLLRRRCILPGNGVGHGCRVPSVRYSWFRAVAAQHWRAMAVATCAAALVIAAALIWSRPATSVSKSAGQVPLGYAQVSRPAPAFNLPRLQGGGSVRLSALRGRPVVINFWSSTCAPCKKESPAIAQAAAAMGDKVSFVGIDTADLRNAAIAFVRKSHVTYSVAYD